MALSRLRLLALRPPRAPRSELAPELIAIKNGTPYERRLTVLLRRAWPLVEEAVRAAGAHLELDVEGLVSAVTTFPRPSFTTSTAARKRASIVSYPSEIPSHGCHVAR